MTISPQQQQQSSMVAIESPVLEDPLSFDDGDVVLRSGSVDFRVHSFMLRQASPFFKAMFALPQPKSPSDNESSSAADAIPTIVMHETPQVLDKLLRWIYPLRHKPTVTSIAEATALSQASEKLEIACAIQPILDSLTHLLAREPNALRAWALAVIFKHDEAKLDAAIRFVRITPNTLLPRVTELDGISALQYADLLHCRQEAHLKARTAVSYEYTSWWGCKKCCRDANDVRMRTGREDNIPEWFELYRERIADRNPLVDDVSSDGLFDACIASSACANCKSWYESLGASSRPAVLIRRKLDQLNEWITRTSLAFLLTRN
ncbi:hypothetical protein DL93DRAFT_2081294 [Clavulina sp. PMI_390]|nr:hypothetical protein DL93DRAFT_2081294 [Clavulina sp. PMI_390]